MSACAGKTEPPTMVVIIEIAAGSAALMGSTDGKSLDTVARRWSCLPLCDDRIAAPATHEIALH